MIARILTYHRHGLEAAIIKVSTQARCRCKQLLEIRAHILQKSAVMARRVAVPAAGEGLNLFVAAV